MRDDSLSSEVLRREDSQESARNIPSGLVTPHNGSDTSEDDGPSSEELRRLDEDFQKNLQRANKVYYSRMDNLQRSHIEREAQHQKTLEKHQKEKEEFEKRLQQEEKEQNRRIEQLQREWDRKREMLAKAKRNRASDDEASISASANVSLASSPDHGYTMPTEASGDPGAAEQFALNPSMSNDTASVHDS